MSATTHLKVEGITKRFGDVVAVDSASFDVRRGEIHCLLGENGAGKSTLSECLYGFFRPDAGTIYLDGKEVSYTSPRDAISSGIGMVHQHFVLVPTFSVIENIILGTHATGWSLDLADARRRLTEICDSYEIEVDFDAEVWQLSVGEQQWVEILKALYLGVELLILDEPTATLTPQESEKLFRIVRRMTANGLSVILITHKLNEVMLSDRVTVLRKGRVVSTLETAGTSRTELTNLMVGRTVMFRLQREKLEHGKKILEARGLKVRDDKGLPALNGISFDLHANEILGIAGMAGNGQKELFEALVGARRIEDGNVLLNDEDITNQTPRSAIDRGIGYIPDDRYGAGLVSDFTVEENMILGLQKKPDFSRHALLDYSRVGKFAANGIADFEIVTPSTRARTSTLSGGNAQKIILARELWSSSCCLLANQPTRGLDVGVIEYVHGLLLRKRKEGFAILLASEELDDIIALSDRIGVMFKGEIMGIFDAGTVTLEQLGLLMAGQGIVDSDRPATAGGA